MSGSAKGVTAAKTMGRKYIRNRGYGGGTRTAAQAAVKSVFKQLSQGWKSLTNEQILAWNSLALSQAGRSILGTSSKITGSNLYMRLNYWIVYCGGDALTVPPTRILSSIRLPSRATLLLPVSRPVSTLHIFSSTSSLQLNCAIFPFTVIRHMTGISPFFFGAIESAAGLFHPQSLQTPVRVEFLPRFAVLFHAVTRPVLR